MPKKTKETKAKNPAVGKAVAKDAALVVADKAEGAVDIKWDSEAARQGFKNLQRGVGEVAILMASHPVYGGLFLGDLRRIVVPPVLFNQYRIIRNQQARTLGFVSWAMVNEAVLKRLMKGLLKLRFQDWQSGDNAVIMDVAAFTPEAGQRMLAEVKKSEFAETRLWNSCPNAAAGEPKLTEWKPLNG